jgi:hypothetical protein
MFELQNTYPRLKEAVQTTNLILDSISSFE